MRHPRAVALLVLVVMLGLPGLPAAGGSAQRKCAMACGAKCCCRPASGTGSCAMRASCCPVPLSDTATTSIPKGKPTARAILLVPSVVRGRETIRDAVTFLRDLPSPPDPPPRSAC